MMKVEDYYLKRLRQYTMKQLREYLNNDAYLIVEEVRKHKNSIRLWMTLNPEEVKRLKEQEPDYYIELIEKKFGFKMTERERIKIADEYFLIKVELGLI